jgi:hypothetical protein
MFKKMRKVTETDCFDSCKFSKSHLASEKKKSPGKTLFTRKKGLILETITQTESNATARLTRLPSWTKVSIGTRLSVPGPHDSIKKLRAL